MTSLRQLIQERFGKELEISGGFGASVEDAIRIDAGYPFGVDLEYTVLKFIHAMIEKNWQLEKPELREVDGRYFDVMYVVTEDDPDNYHKYYFDITKPYLRK